MIGSVTTISTNLTYRITWSLTKQNREGVYFRDRSTAAESGGLLCPHGML